MKNYGKLLRIISRGILLLSLSALLCCGCAASAASDRTAQQTEPQQTDQSELQQAEPQQADQSDKQQPASEPQQADQADEQQADLPAAEKVIALSKSNAELWLLAGGSLAGTSEDAMELQGISSETVSLGDMDHVSLEAVASLEPDLLILFSTDPAQRALGEAAEGIGLPVFYTNIDSFADYRDVMRTFTRMTGREDLYQKNVEEVGAEIEEICSGVPEKAGGGRYLLLHVSATKSKVEKNDYFACEILNDLGLVNIASDSSEFDELSMEAIVASDPDYLFVVPRGDEEKAIDSFDGFFRSHPAWDSLSAVKEQHFYLLPKELFGLKPNGRWAESYRQARELLYGE